MDPSETKELNQLDEVGQILLSAADYIEKHGWCQNNLSLPTGEVCMLGAIRIVLGKDLAYSREYRAIRGRLRELIDRHSIPNFNDRPDITKEDVLAVIREAARGPAC